MLQYEALHADAGRGEVRALKEELWNFWTGGSPTYAWVAFNEIMKTNLHLSKD